jgi:HD-GYP domain-containing protein (c-di-GMP phosphodiesterase class II)
LTDEEFEKIKEHPVIGTEIISKMGLWNQEMGIVKHHHERFDGKGYPNGLKGNKIPRLARILCVADSFDAMTSDRAYRKKMEESQALGIIEENSGSQFDPEAVHALLKIAEQGLPVDLQ